MYECGRLAASGSGGRQPGRDPKDHINTMPGTPMVGLNDDRFGERFFSLANAYDAEYRALLQKVAKEEGFPLTEGVFVSYPGPNFETAAEIRMMQIIGGDVVGMSVVPEVISARHCDLKVVAVSAITNMAEGLSDVKLSHAQTLAAAELEAELHQPYLWLSAQNC